MSVFIPDFLPSPEAHRARSGPFELPRCDGLRIAALAMALTQYLRTTRGAQAIDLGLVIQAFFALTGFLLADFLIRDRKEPEVPRLDDLLTKVGALLRTLPTPYLCAVVAIVVYLPGLLAMESVPVPDLKELPALIVRCLTSSLADFLRDSADGRSLVVWPLIVLFLPRRCLGLAFLGFLGSGLTVQFSGLLSGEVRPASILVAPSPLDLLAAGALVAAIVQGMGRSGNGPLARWALLMGLALATATIGFRSDHGLTNWGSLALLSAPPGFGAVNFILKIMATTLVGSHAWRDLGR
jgi:hypothetical protein